MTDPAPDPSRPRARVGVRPAATGRGWVLAGCLALLVSLLTGCAGAPSVYLKDLQADPKATWVPPGGKLLFERSADYKAGSSSSKPRQASIIRSFRVRPGPNLDAAIAAANTYAADHGWTPVGGVSKAFERPGPLDSRADLFVSAGYRSSNEINVSMGSTGGVSAAQ